MKEREIRAVFDDETITVYQAFRPEIAIAAVQEQTFVPPAFSMTRMTWIKPSFLWMMYRSGWGQKKHQERILAIRITREGWEWALRHAVLTHFEPDLHGSQDTWKRTLQSSPVRVQWDPEKNIQLHNQSHRSIQVGLSGEAVVRYIEEWIVDITDITTRCREMQALVESSEMNAVQQLLPVEEIYLVSEEIKERIHHS